MITINVKASEKMKTNADYSGFVSFPFDNAILDIMRAQSSRFWHKEAKEWEVPIDRLPKLIESLGDREIKLTGVLEKIERPEVTLPEGFTFKTEPYDHQLEGFLYGMQYDRFLLGDEQGLGKTKQVIDIAVGKKLTRGYKHCLIIACVNGLKWNWYEEVYTHSNESAWVLGQRTNRKGRVSVPGNKEKLEDLRNLPDDYFLITNVESVRDADIVAEIQKLVKSGEINMIATDEIHKCKNPSSQQGKGLLKLTAETLIALTGTPLLNKPLDLYMPLRWLEFERHSYFAFKKHYCVMGGYGGYEIISYKNLSELQDQLQSIQLRRLKKDVLDLPDKIRVNEYVEMSVKQRKVYDEIYQDTINNIDRVKMSNNPLAQMIRLRQATGYTGILSSAIHESAKLDRMVEYVEDFTEAGKKIIIYSQWTQITDEVRRRLKDYNVAVITGQFQDYEKREAEKRFMTDPDCMILVGTTGALGTGYTLTAATVEIFLDEPWNMKEKEQNEDRAHRIGTTEPLTIITLLTKNTIDERINQLVFKKGVMADMMVDGTIDMNNPQIIDFLLS